MIGCCIRSICQCGFFFFTVSGFIDRPCVENRRGLGSVIIIIIIVRYNKQYTRVVVNVCRSLSIIESKTEFKKYVYIYVPNKLMIYAND